MYRIDHESMTVVYTDPRGEEWDMNADGEPIESASDLEEFVHELYSVDAFDAVARDRLIEEIGQA